MQFVVFENFYECFCIPNCRRKIMWLLINYTHEKISHEAFTAFFFKLLSPKIPQKLCLVSEVHIIQYIFVIVVFRSPRLPDLNYPVIFFLQSVFSFSILPSNSGLKCCYFPLCCCTIATFQSINVISTFCTQPQYQFSALG